MKFRITVRDLREVIASNLTTLVEGRVQDVEKKYPDLDIKWLSSVDPSAPNHKYLMWMARQLIDNRVHPEDLIPTVEYFHKNLARFKKRDINAYSTLKELEDEVKNVSEKKTQKEKRALSKEGSEVVYENDDVSVVYVGTKESCQLYGANTKWCITMRDAHYFEQYTGANVVFYFVLKKKPENNSNDKIAIAIKKDIKNNVLIEEEEFYDAEDNNIDFNELNRNPKPISNIEEILKVVYADAIKRPMSLIAKLKHERATEEEQRQIFELYKEEPRFLSKIVGYFSSNSVLDDIQKDT